MALLANPNSEGRDAASVANFTKYSDGLKKLRESGFVWTDENMDKWIADCGLYS